ncbi:MAG: HAMP domain-containing histidine kinase [Candidatus Sumerlaeia bacterium]|nr:HAMP domain-containing histidine kinase [Candidatus Sumerlaeia bacterium]
MNNEGENITEATTDSPGFFSRFVTRMRTKLIVPFATFLYLGTIFGGLYTLENAYYVVDKWGVIQNLLTELSYIDNDQANQASNVVKRYVESNYRRVEAGRTLTDEERERHWELLDQVSEKLLESSPVITGMAVEDKEGAILYEYRVPERVWEQHDFTNSLLTRSFERSFKRTFIDESRQAYLGTMRIYVTTAKGSPEITELTTKYRNYMIIFVLGVSILYYGLVRSILMPLNRVIDSIINRQSGRSSIIKTPRTTLERAFNQLARDATLTRFSKQMRDEIAHQGLSYVEPLLEFIPSLTTRLIELPGTQIWVLSRQDEKAPWDTEKVFGSKSGESDREHFKKVLMKEIEGDDENPIMNWEPKVLAWKDSKEKQRLSFIDILDAGFDRLRFFVIHGQPGESAPTEEVRTFYGRLAQELRYALGSVEEQRRLILQEKSKANISLSRNLGHDLTNIIATSKLELMTIKTFLSLPAGEVAHSPAKAEMFRESLEALLNNTRFLQEIVNLYRSFSYLQKPKFEQIDINTIIVDVVQLYELSLSKSFVIEKSLAKKLPPVRVEPRLLRLALFNLLTNSTDAIKKVDGNGNQKGRISISSVINHKRGYVEIRVEDNGPGIRDGKGNLLATDKIPEIFRLGYTTKDNQEGEGLGLNWVQNIVREFHHGDIIAANIEKGGAMFAIRIPIESPAGTDSQAAVEVGMATNSKEKGGS